MPEEAVDESNRNNKKSPKQKPRHLLFRKGFGLRPALIHPTSSETAPTLLPPAAPPPPPPQHPSLPFFEVEATAVPATEYPIYNASIVLDQPEAVDITPPKHRRNQLILGCAIVLLLGVLIGVMTATGKNDGDNGINSDTILPPIPTNDETVTTLPNATISLPTQPWTTDPPDDGKADNETISDSIPESVESSKEPSASPPILDESTTTTPTRLKIKGRPDRVSSIFVSYDFSEYLFCFLYLHLTLHNLDLEIQHLQPTPSPTRYDPYDTGYAEGAQAAEQRWLDEGYTCSDAWGVDDDYDTHFINGIYGLCQCHAR